MIKSKDYKFVPPSYFLFLLLFSLILHFVIPSPKILDFPYTGFGYIFIVFGIWLNLKADRMFKKVNTEVNPYQNPKILVTEGPFRISRHPMYLGMLLCLIGTSFILGTLITFISPIIFVIIMERKFIPLEEKKMQKAFGKKYSDYKNKVRRWI